MKDKFLFFVIRMHILLIYYLGIFVFISCVYTIDNI